MADGEAERAATEQALQEFIDALQGLILLLPTMQRSPERVFDGFPAVTGMALQRTITAARQLQERLPQLARALKAD